MLKKIYLAGPDVFIIDSDIGERKKALCLSYGFAPLYPLDNEVSGDNAAAQIFKANCRMIDQADLVLANASPFRGPHCDPGTSFEIGYALAQSKPVCIYTNDSRTLLERINEDYPTMNSGNTFVEDFAHPENLMIAESALFTTVCVDDRDDLSALKAFEQTLARLKSEVPGLAARC